MEDQEIEFKIINLMQELQQNEIIIENLSAPFLDLIEITKDDLNNVSRNNREKSIEIENKIRELTLLRAKSIKTGSGSITYRKGSFRRSWDLDKLDEVCNIDDNIKSRIWNFRKENIGEPSVTIKVDTKGTSMTEI